MNREFNTIDINTINEFIDGETHDVYLLVRKTCYKDLYMTLYQYTFRDLNDDSPLETFVIKAYTAYKKQNRLNKALKVTDGRYYDEYLLKCVVNEIFIRYPSASSLKDMTQQSFLEKVIEYERKTLDNVFINEYNIGFLISHVKENFHNREDIKVCEILNLINTLANNQEQKKDHEDYFEYLNNLIDEKKFTLNQLGNDSGIKKGIYELSLDKLPTKNQLIMLILALKLNSNEQQKILNLAKEQVRNKSNSNLYSFENNNERDILIEHWLNNLEALENMAEKKNKTTVNILNDILKERDFETLK